MHLSLGWWHGCFAGGLSAGPEFVAPYSYCVGSVGVVVVAVLLSPFLGAWIEAVAVELVAAVT